MSEESPEQMDLVLTLSITDLVFTLSMRICHENYCHVSYFTLEAHLSGTRRMYNNIQV